MRKLHLMNELMATALRENTDALLKALSAFDYQGFNHHPPGAVWTAGEIAEHILIFDIRVTTILSGKSAAANRDPQEKINAFQERLADRTNRMDAPTYLIPSPTPKGPSALTEKILIQRRQLTATILNQDLSRIFPDNPHPIYGTLTGIEWIQLLILHCNRHLEQFQQCKI